MRRTSSTRPQNAGDARRILHVPAALHYAVEDESKFLNLYRRASAELLLDTYLFHKSKLGDVLANGQQHHIRIAEARLRMLGDLCAKRGLLDIAATERIADETLLVQPTHETHFSEARKP